MELPSIFEWKVIASKSEWEKVVKFLNKNYLCNEYEKLQYTEEIIKWSLGSKGFILSFIAKSNGNICGVIGFGFKTLTVMKIQKETILFDYLCLHPKYRGTNLINLLKLKAESLMCGLSAFSTTMTTIQKPISIISFYDRILNKIPISKVSTRLSTLIDIPEILKLQLLWLPQFKIYCTYDAETFINTQSHYTYVILKDDIVVDFLSFYFLNVILEGQPIIRSYLLTYTAFTVTPKEILDLYFSLCSQLKVSIANVTNSMGLSKYIGPEFYSSGQLNFNLHKWDVEEDIDSNDISWMTV